jgi:hypothetical protein
MVALAGGVSTVGVGQLDQLGHRLTQPRRIQPPRRLSQDRVSVQLHMFGQILGSLGDHRGMRR